jgi:hypothetical protein
MFLPLVPLMGMRKNESNQTVIWTVENKFQTSKMQFKDKNIRN